MKKVTSFSLGRFNNAYHVNYHNNVVAMIKQTGAASLGLTTAIAEKYEQAVLQETDAVKRSQASVETQKIREADTQRDNGYRFIRNVLVNLQYSQDAELRALYDTAKAKILNVYASNVPEQSINEESAHIRGFVMDVRSTFRDSLAKMGIADALTALETANNELQEMYLNRAGSQASFGTEYTVKCRAITDEAYNQIVARIEYTGQLTEATDDSTVGKRNACLSFIDTLNQVITRTWQSIKIGGGDGPITTGPSSGSGTEDNGNQETGDSGNQETGNSGNQENTGNPPSGGGSGTQQPSSPGTSNDDDDDFTPPEIDN